MRPESGADALGRAATTHLGLLLAVALVPEDGNEVHQILQLQVAGDGEVHKVVPVRVLDYDGFQDVEDAADSYKASLLIHILLLGQTGFPTHEEKLSISKLSHDNVASLNGNDTGLSTRVGLSHVRDYTS